MLRYIHKMDGFDTLFEKIKYESDKYGASYTAMIFYLNDESRLNEFGDFLLKYLRISDTVFEYSTHKLLVILEETTVRGSMILNEKLREKIEEKGFKYDYFCSSVQGEFIENSHSLEKKLKKRLKIARETNSKECIHDLSSI